MRDSFQKIFSYLRKNLVFLLLILSFLGGVWSQYIRVTEHKENDHWVYYRTAKRISDKSIQEIYSRKDGSLPFRYSPPALMLFSWMDAFSEETSRKIWLIGQSLFILAGFRLLYLVLIKINSTVALNSIAFSFFLFYRYFLDSLFCGQISGTAFFIFCLGLYYWINDKKSKSNNSLLFLFFLKIIPGFIVMINLASSKSFKEFFKLVLNLLLAIFVVQIVFLIWFIVKFGVGHISEFLPMYKTWMEIVTADQQYFDGSTIKNQALRGVLLRVLGSNEKSEFIWKIVFVGSILSLIYFWFKVKINSLKLKVYSYLLGILAFVLLMPQSLPYQILKLMIPFVFIMSEYLMTYKKSIGTLLFLVLIFCTLPTADLVGHRLADFVQYQSLPFFSFIVMTAFIVNEIFLS